MLSLLSSIYNCIFPSPLLYIAWVEPVIVPPVIFALALFAKTIVPIEFPLEVILPDFTFIVDSLSILNATFALVWIFTFSTFTTVLDFCPYTNVSFILTPPEVFEFFILKTPPLTPNTFDSPPTKRLYPFKSNVVFLDISIWSTSPNLTIESILSTSCIVSPLSYFSKAKFNIAYGMVVVTPLDDFTTCATASLFIVIVFSIFIVPP